MFNNCCCLTRIDELMRQTSVERLELWTKKCASIGTSFFYFPNTLLLLSLNKKGMIMKFPSLDIKDKLKYTKVKIMVLGFKGIIIPDVMQIAV